MSEQDQCPDCGSENAISKAAAWDALTSTPPKIQEELDRLRVLERAAQRLQMHPGDKDTIACSIPVSVFEAIRDAL